MGNLGSVPSELPRKKFKKKENPRELRKRAEKQRRDNLNQSIAELSAMVPPVVKSCRKMNKITILRLTAHYLRAHQYVFGDTIGHSKMEFSTAFTQTLLEFFKGFLLTTTYKGIVVVVSQNVNRYLGYSEVDLLGQNILSITHEDDQKMLKEQLTPKYVRLGLNGELFIPDGPDGVREVELSLGKQKRQFVVRFKKRTLRSQSPQYLTCYVEGFFRKADHAGAMTGVQFPRRARVRGDYPRPSGNDIVFVGIVRTATETFMNEIAMESYWLEYRTRHTVDGEIIQSEYRIALVTGYMMKEVQGVNAMNFMHRDDVRWVIFALREMYDKSQLYGESCYRLMAKNGEFIYMRTRGQLDLQPGSRAVTSFVCTNTVLGEEEGKRLIKLMKNKYSLLVNNSEDLPKLEVSNNQSVSVEDPKRLEKAILKLVTNLPMAPTEEESTGNTSTETGESSKQRLSIIPPNKERVVSAIEKIYDVINIQRDPEHSASVMDTHSENNTVEDESPELENGNASDVPSTSQNYPAFQNCASTSQNYTSTNQTCSTPNEDFPLTSTLNPSSTQNSSESFSHNGQSTSQDNSSTSQKLALASHNDAFTSESCTPITQNSTPDNQISLSTTGNCTTTNQTDTVNSQTCLSTSQNYTYTSQDYPTSTQSNSSSEPDDDQTQPLTEHNYALTNQNHTSAVQNYPTTSQNDTSNYQTIPSTSHHVQATFQEDPSTSQKLALVSQNNALNNESYPATSQNDISNHQTTQNLTINGQNDTVNSQTCPSTSQNNQSPTQNNINHSHDQLSSTESYTSNGQTYHSQSYPSTNQNPPSSALTFPSTSRNFPSTAQDGPSTSQNYVITDQNPSTSPSTSQIQPSSTENNVSTSQSYISYLYELLNIDSSVLLDFNSDVTTNIALTESQYEEMAAMAFADEDLNNEIRNQLILSHNLNIDEYPTTSYTTTEELFNNAPYNHMENPMTGIKRPADLDEFFSFKRQATDSAVDSEEISMPSSPTLDDVLDEAALSFRIEAAIDTLDSILDSPSANIEPAEEDNEPE